MSLLSKVLHKTHFENWSGEELASYNPADGKELGRVRLAEEEDYDDVLWDAVKTFDGGAWSLLLSAAKSFARWRRAAGGEGRAGVAGDARNGKNSR